MDNYEIISLKVQVTFCKSCMYPTSTFSKFTHMTANDYKVSIISQSPIMASFTNICTTFILSFFFLGSQMIICWNILLCTS